jgi:hypothetical protein
MGLDGSGREHAIEILYKIGGSGFTKVVNSWLASGNFNGHFDGLNLAIKRFDQETINELVQITQQEELLNDFPYEQGKAAFVLAQLGQVNAVIKAIMRWGRSWNLDSIPLDDDVTLAIFDNLQFNDKILPGTIIAIGVAGRTDKLNIVRAALKNSPQDSKVVLACIITIGRLHDDSPETTELIAKHLEIEEHRHAARVALLQIASNNALDKLLDHLEKQYDEWLVVNLFNYDYSFNRALNEVQKHLENKSDRDKLKTLSNLSKTSQGDKILSILLGQKEFKDIARSGLYIDENSSSRHIGLKVSAIEILAMFDKDVAFEAAWATLQDINAHDREYYPYIMVSIDKQRAISSLISQLGVEYSCRVIWAIRSALSGVSNLIHIDRLLKSPNTLEKLAAVRLAGWIKLPTELENELKKCLNEIDEHISLSARESLEQIDIFHEVEVLIEAINSEQDISRKWILLDALLAIADPGDEHTNWPCWASELFKTLPPHMQHYFYETIKKRRDELSKEMDSKDKQSHRS